MKFVYILVFLLCFSCTSKNPRPEDATDANYGAPPKSENMADTARSLLREMGYFDPSNTEIDRCTEFQKTYRKGEVGTEWRNFDMKEFVYGYEFSCEVNAPNRFGAKTGFKSVKFFFENKHRSNR